MNQVPNIQNAEGPGLFKNIAKDIGRAGLTAGLQIPGLVYKQLSNQANDLGVYLIGGPIQELAQNENAIFAKVKELVLKLDEIDNRLGSDEQLVQIRKKITEKFIEVVGGSIDDIVNSPKLQNTLNNLLDGLKKSGVNTAKVFITGAKDIVLEVPGLGAAVAIVDTGTKSVIAGSSVLSSLIAMAETGAIVAKTTNETIQKIMNVLNEFSLPPSNINQMAQLPTIDEMRERNKEVSNVAQPLDDLPPTYQEAMDEMQSNGSATQEQSVSNALPDANALPNNNALPTIDEMRQRNKGLTGGARYLKTLTKRKNTIEKRISGSIGKFMNNKLTKKRRRHKYTHKRYSRR